LVRSRGSQGCRLPSTLVQRRLRDFEASSRNLDRLLEEIERRLGGLPLKTL
jgi:hypothetical protein